MRDFIFACVGAFMYAVLWTDDWANQKSVATQRISIAKETMKLMEESQQLEGGIYSMLITIFDEVDGAFATKLTQESVDWSNNCDQTLWAMLSTYNRISEWISQDKKKIMDKLDSYSAERLPLALLDKYKHHVGLDLARSRKRHASVKELERRCRITNKL